MPDEFEGLGLPNYEETAEALEKKIEDAAAQGLELGPIHDALGELSSDQVLLLAEVAVALARADSSMLDDSKLAWRFVGILLQAFQATKGGLFTLGQNGEIVTLAARSGSRAVSVEEFSRTRILEVLAKGTFMTSAELVIRNQPRSIALNEPGPTVHVPIFIPGQVERVTFAVLALVRDPGEQGFGRERQFLELVGTLLGPLVHRSQLYQTTMVEKSKLKEERDAAREEAATARETAILEMSVPRDDSGTIIGSDPAIRQALDRVAIAARNHYHVLIIGATGTGKELIAKAIHNHPLSLRKGKPFVTMNCASANETLLESTLFGHVQGAFTGASTARPGLIRSAAGGTLFLDEIQSAPRGLLDQLLRVLETKVVRPVGGDPKDEKQVDFRLIAASNKDLAIEKREGRFPADVYTRLDQVSILLPPLKERRGDLPHLIMHFFQVALKEQAQAIPEELRGKARGARRVSGEALTLLTQYDWPENVRQLQNVVAKCVMYARGSEITREDVIDQLREADRAVGREYHAPKVVERGEDEAITREMLVQALEGSKGDVSAAAKMLKVSRQYLYKRIKSWGISVAREKETRGRPRKAHALAGDR